VLANFATVTVSATHHKRTLSFFPSALPTSHAHTHTHTHTHKHTHTHAHTHPCRACRTGQSQDQIQRAARVRVSGVCMCVCARRRQRLASSMNRGFDRVISRCEASLRRPAMSSSENVPYSRSSADFRARQHTRVSSLSRVSARFCLRARTPRSHSQDALQGRQWSCAYSSGGVPQVVSARAAPSALTALFDVDEHHLPRHSAKPVKGHERKTKITALKKVISNFLSGALCFM
jgi:hypothetical protein